MTLAHDFDYVALQPHDDSRRGEQRRAPRFTTMDVARLRENGFKPRSAREIAKDVLVRNAETLRRLGE